jgi:hypothetical protein
VAQYHICLNSPNPEVDLSPIHIWMDYQCKNETSIENAQVEFYQYNPKTGERQFQIPHIGLSEVMDSFWQAFWDPMPDGRKALLISGLLALVTARVDYTQEENCPISKYLRCPLVDKIKRTAEAQEIRTQIQGSSSRRCSRIMPQTNPPENPRYYK